MSTRSASSGSGVAATRPSRAAALPPILTVVEPASTLPLFDGVFWKEVPGGVGMCDGLFVASEPTTAASWPPIFTDPIVPPVIVPENGCGSGVGTAPLGAGTITTWMSIPTTGSFLRAAGCPIAIKPSVDGDLAALDRDLAAAGDLDLRSVKRDLLRPLESDRAPVLLELDRGVVLRLDL